MSKIKKGEEDKSSSTDEDNDLSTHSSSKKESPNFKTISNNIKNIHESKNDSCIVEVYKENFVEEMKNIALLIKEYNYIGMDTEFPGIVFSLAKITDDFYYKSLKLNVDSLKLIQLGITLSNDKGEFPIPHHTWQFNFEFDYTKDKFSKSSINLLMSSGIDFNKMKENGINHKKFIEQFKTSGLVLNPYIHWVSFHGSYDFGYLLSNLLENSLPNNEEDFTQILSLFFPNHYDIRILVKDIYYLKGSLNKLVNFLKVERKGKNHQAGSDSLATIDVFWKLFKNGFLTKEELLDNKNILYGILKGKDDNETINYTKINLQRNKTISCNNIYKNINNDNFNNNLTNLYFRNNIYNINMNYCYPQNIMNLYHNGLNGEQIMNNTNNIIQY